MARTEIPNAYTSAIYRSAFSSSECWQKFLPCGNTEIHVDFDDLLEGRAISSHAVTWVPARPSLAGAALRGYSEVPMSKAGFQHVHEHVRNTSLFKLLVQQREGLLLALLINISPDS